MKTLKKRFLDFLQVLKPMSWKQRIDHIFTYYKSIFLVAACLLIAISIGVNAINRNLNPPLYRGALIGVNMPEPAKTYLTDELQLFLDGANSKRDVILREIEFMDIMDDQSMSTNQAAYYQITTLVSGKELEYALMDKHAWGLLKDGFFFTDLQTLLPQDIFTQLAPYIQWATNTETGVSVALAIDVSHLPLIKENTSGDTPVYLAFPGNTENNHFTQAFIQHLWQFTN